MSEEQHSVNSIIFTAPGSEGDLVVVFVAAHTIVFVLTPLRRVLLLNPVSRRKQPEWVGSTTKLVLSE